DPGGEILVAQVVDEGRRLVDDLVTGARRRGLRLRMSEKSGRTGLERTVPAGRGGVEARFRPDAHLEELTRVTGGEAALDVECGRLRRRPARRVGQRPLEAPVRLPVTTEEELDRGALSAECDTLGRLVGRDQFECLDERGVAVLEPADRGEG